MITFDILQKKTTITFEIEFTQNLTFEITITDLDYDPGDHLDLITVHPPINIFTNPKILPHLQKSNHPHGSSYTRVI